MENPLKLCWFRVNVEHKILKRCMGEQIVKGRDNGHLTFWKDISTSFQNLVRGAFQTFVLWKSRLHPIFFSPTSYTTSYLIFLILHPILHPNFFTLYLTSINHFCNSNVSKNGVSCFWINEFWEENFRDIVAKYLWIKSVSS